MRLGSACVPPLVALLCVPACKGKDSTEPAPIKSAPSAAPSAAVPSASARGNLDRDPQGHLRPHTPRPADNPADIPRAPGQEPDWDLDPDDPARDYVDRYVRATSRYADRTPCAEAKQNGSTGGKAIVEVRDAKRAPASCGASAPSDALRDVFLVDVGADRMEIDAARSKAPLGRWPDGSDPGGPPNPPADVDKLAAPLESALVGMKLVPIRTQLYARGSYVVVTLAGWRAPLAVNAPPESLRPTVETLCAASRGLPMGFFAGIDRSLMLRVRCPNAARWQSM